MTVDASAKIRADLKAAGYGVRDVSVRNDSYSMGSSVDVKIKRAEVPLEVIEEIAYRQQQIRRDESGEILGGGNMFVHVDYAHGVLDAYAALAAQQIEAGRTSFGTLHLSENADSLWLDIWQTGDGGQHVSRLDRRYPGEGLARALARRGALGVLLEWEPAEPEPLPVTAANDVLDACREAAAMIDPAILLEAQAAPRRRIRACKAGLVDSPCFEGEGWLVPFRPGPRPPEVWALCSED
jgi:hypothetical protein